MSVAEADARAEVLRVRDVSITMLANVLHRYGMKIEQQHLQENIAGSYWGDSEAGLIGTTVYLRADTPIHSVLHEASHCVCMTADRRIALSKDAGGDYDEENAVCYLQILLADHLSTMGRDRMLCDMDTWGYTFRLGSARAWFEQDSQDARQWLLRERLIDEATHVTWLLRA